MPYSFPTTTRTLAIELRSLRKLGKARRLASASNVARAARRTESIAEADEETPAPVTGMKRRRHPS